MQMKDQGDADDKLIAVCANDPAVNHIQDISELPQHFKAELRRFYEDYKKLENKEVVVEKFGNGRKAAAILQDAIRMYESHFGGRTGDSSQSTNR